MAKLRPMPRDIYVKVCPKCMYTAKGEEDYNNTNCWFCGTEMVLTDILYEGINKGGRWVESEGIGDIVSSIGIFDQKAMAARWAGDPPWVTQQPQPTTPTTPTTPPTLTTCPVCGGKVSSAAPACPHCGQPMKEPEPTPVAAPQPVKPVEEKNVPKCPTCGSTNIRRVDGLERSMSFFLWGFGSRKVNKSYKCLHCDYTW